MHREYLIERAERLLDADLALPLDLVAQLQEEGVDVEALETGHRAKSALS